MTLQGMADHGSVSLFTNVFLGEIIFWNGSQLPVLSRDVCNWSKEFLALSGKLGRKYANFLFNSRSLYISPDLALWTKPTHSP